MLRGAIIGYGFIAANGHVPALLERAHLVAIADICEARREVARKTLPGARIYADYRDLLQAEISNLDFVDIATPPCDHAEIAHAALDQGLHVLCEKPLATCSTDASSLLQHAISARRVIFPCHNYKHAPVVRAVREILTSGTVGRVRSVTLNTFRTTHAKGVPEWNTDWRRQLKYSGGGIAMDHGSHTFYLAFEWMGSYPIAISAKISTLSPRLGPPDSRPPSDTEDNVSAVLTFPGGMASAQLSWTAGVRKVIYAIQGEKGAITIDDDDLQIALAHRASERRTISSSWMDASHAGWFRSLFDDFTEAIARAQFVGKDAFEAYLCVDVISQIYRSSAEECREVPLPGGRYLAVEPEEDRENQK